MHTYFCRTVSLGSQFSWITLAPLIVGARTSFFCDSRFALAEGVVLLPDRSFRRCRGFAIVSTDRGAGRGRLETFLHCAFFFSGVGDT